MSDFCDACSREFGSKEALEMHNLAKHSIAGEMGKGERKQAREEIKQGFQQKKIRTKRAKQFFWYGLGIIFVGFIIYGIVVLAKSPGTYSKGPVHWHANLAIFTCGEQIPLPKPTGGSVHGEPFIGTPFMHLHNEPTIHIEGTIKSPADITLGRFMEVIGMNFKEDELLNYKNGDVCPDGTPGKVKLLVNGRESEELTAKVIVDGEKYELRLE